MSSHVYSKLCRIFEATVAHRDKSSPDFKHNASRQNSSLFCQVSYKSIAPIFCTLCIYRSWKKKGNVMLQYCFTWISICRLLWRMTKHLKCQYFSNTIACTHGWVYLPRVADLLLDIQISVLLKRQSWGSYNEILNILLCSPHFSLFHIDFW